MCDFEQPSTSAPGQGDEYIRATRLAATIHVGRQSFDRYKSCLHRHFHHCLLTLPDGTEDSLPELPRVPWRLATNLRKVELPWLLCERLPVRWAQLELCRYTRPWAGSWCDARREFRAAVGGLHARSPESAVSMRLWCWQPYARSCEDQPRQMPNPAGDSEEKPRFRRLVYPSSAARGAARARRSKPRPVPPGGSVAPYALA